MTVHAYREMAQILNQEINGNTIFNGVLEYDTQGLHSTLTCTVIVCQGDPNEESEQLRPVWWEYRIWSSRGELLNDFSWRGLQEAFGGLTAR